MGSLIVWACQSLFALSHPTGGTVAGAIVLKVTDETEITLNSEGASIKDPDEGDSATATLNGEPYLSGTEISVVDKYELKVTAIDTSGNEAEVAVNFDIVAE